MKTYFTVFVSSFVLLVLFGSCEQEDCNRTAQPYLFFTLTDQNNTPIPVSSSNTRVQLVYKNTFTAAIDTVKVIGPISLPDKFSSAVFASSDALDRSTLADSASYRVLINKQLVGTMRLSPFRRDNACDNWTYTANVQFNGRIAATAGPTNETFLLPVTP
ncbi:hypothetical protein [Spirosoma sp. KUDC1026]|uniref:hypothetical protein n=1 Tax=Spirosoma sp. KUDC1026 TaxID=2745947 RepID=UPI00159BC722|nr:hypothetical protein [Spirosoma sp. KUDC1026]QKZ14566.1 hypothetical protein HU175_18830 [Spirosoma sp. KUDC1026]